MTFQKRKKLFSALLAAFVFVLSLNFAQPQVKGFFYEISAPLQKAFWQAGKNTSGFFENLVGSDSLGKENLELELRLERLLAENYILKEAEKENLELKKAMEMGLPEDFSLLLAETCFKDEDSLLLDKGRKQGVSEGLPVITSERVLVGRVKESFENFSLVSLVSDREISFNAEIEGSVQGVVKGQGGSAFFEFIPLKSEVEEGKNVFSTGFEGVFPEGLLVGRIGKVKKDDAASFQKAEIDLYFDPFETGQVFLIKNF